MSQSWLKMITAIELIEPCPTTTTKDVQDIYGQLRPTAHSPESILCNGLFSYGQHRVQKGTSPIRQVK